MLNDNSRTRNLFVGLYFPLLAICISTIASADNPIVNHTYTADVSGRVFGDRLYLYTSHDTYDAKYFDMTDWRVFSSDDLIHWHDHGSVLSLKDISWAEKWAWAPDCVERGGKYYFYFPVERTKIGVAVCDKPTGPFKDALGKPLIDNSIDPFAGKEPIDPAVFIDDDGQAYLYFGCRQPRVVRLKDSMIEMAGELKEVVIVDKDGTKQMWQEGQWFGNIQKSYGGQAAFGEAPWVFKKDGKYYYLYSNGWAEDSALVYAISDNPEGPFVYQGKVMESVETWTQHGSIFKYKDQWYVAYHRMPLSNDNYRRSVCIDQLVFNDDGTIRTVKATKGLGPVRNHADFDPGKDLLSLHYDHAPDKDDGQSAAADRTMLETLTSTEWIKGHTVAVSGTYGLNKESFNKDSNKVMDAVWGDTGWIAAHDNWQAAVEALTKKWQATLNNGGNIWVKEGGQSDMTADVIKQIINTDPNVNTKDRIFVVQHADWNEEQTTPEALAYTRKMTTYVRISDANRYLNIKGDINGANPAFEKAALAHPRYGKYWKAAFDYYPTSGRLDFSDTGELLYILKHGELGIKDFQEHFLQ